MWSLFFRRLLQQNKTKKLKGNPLVKILYVGMETEMTQENTMTKISNSL